MATGGPIQIRMRAASDWTMLVVGSVLSFACAFTLATSTATDWATPTGARGEWFVLFIDREFGVTTVRLLVALMGFWSACIGLGALWRLKDRHHALSADRNGITLHPSLCPKALRWSDVESVMLTGRRPARIEVKTKKRFWSFASPFTSKTIDLNLWAADSTYRTASAAVAQMRRWLKA